MGVNSPFTLHLSIVAPDSLEHFSSTEGLARMSGQEDEQSEFGGGQVQWSLTPLSLPPTATHDQVTGVEQVGVNDR
jgi:hypothetical protein